MHNLLVCGAVEYAVVMTLAKSVKLHGTGTPLRLPTVAAAARPDWGWALAALGAQLAAPWASVLPLAAGLALHALALLALAELYYFVRTGSHGDAYLLRLIGAHWRDILLPIQHRPGRTLARLSLLLLAAQVPLLFGVLLATALGPRSEPPLWSLVFTGLIGLLLLVWPAGAAPGRYRDIGVAFPRAMLGDFFRPAPWADAPPRTPRPDLASESLQAPSPVMGAAPAALAGLAGARHASPNIVVVMLESARNFSHLPEDALPFLNRLARTGRSVDTMYGVVPHTTKALLPILTGRYPTAEPDLGASSLASALAGRGYETAFFTPADLRFEGKGKLIARMGFQQAYGAQEIDRTGRRRSHYLGYADEDVVAPAADWAGAVAARQAPFLLTLLTLTSHHPYRTPSDGAPEPDDRARYVRALRYADGCVAQLFDRLAAAGLTDNTVFAVVGDHGQAFGEHGRRYHSASLWDETIRVPCVVWGPGPGAASHIGGPRSQLDVTPTLLQLAGLSPLRAADGYSLLAPADRTRELFHATWIDHQSLSLRRGPMKYIHHFGREPAEFYDTHADPLETTNLIGRLAAEEAAAWARDCLAWRRCVAPV